MFDSVANINKKIQIIISAIKYKAKTLSIKINNNLNKNQSPLMLN